ncbi:MAG TPA: type II secretion system protein [Acidimicrobiales bacterium]|nr:type II secretion system protein [Acidimicrobiales bacterium]
MTARRRSRDRGFTLIEVLVTVAIIGIAFVVFVAGMGIAITSADLHRKLATGQASIRNFGEAVKAAPYVDCATTTSYAGVYSPTPADRLSASDSFTDATAHVAPDAGDTAPAGALLTFFALARGSSFSTPSAMGERWDLASGAASATDRVTVALDDQQWSGGVTGTRTATSGSAGDSVAQTVVLPAAGSLVMRGTSTASVTPPPPPTTTTSASTTTTTLAPTITLAKPAGTAAGDLMVAQIAIRGGDAASITAPTGWILVNAKTSGLSVLSAIFQRIAASSDATSYTWALDSARDAAGGIVSYGGVAASQYTATVTSVLYWSGTSFVETCPSPDTGLQRVSLRIASSDGKDVETVDLVKRRP